MSKLKGNIIQLNFAKVVKDLNPKAFLAENVKGLTTHDNGKTLRTMISIYESMGYQVTWNILKANDYGVAQKRERVVIIGIRKAVALLLAELLPNRKLAL
jgi:DNA (cytosine-5)-methyltransferase 1